MDADMYKFEKKKLETTERVFIVPLHHLVITFYRPWPYWMAETFNIAQGGGGGGGIGVGTK